MTVGSPGGAPRGLRWWRVMAQAQKTGRCPFCGAPLPPQTFYNVRYGFPVGRGYATVCPQCGQSSFPLPVKLAIVVGTFTYAAIVVALGLLVGWTAAGLVLFGTLVLVFIPILIYAVLQGQLFNALCLLIALGIAGAIWVWPVVTASRAPSYSVRVSASVPLKEHLGRPVSASLLIRNTGSSLDYVDLDFGDSSVASTSDPNIVTAAWQLNGITVNGRSESLEKDDGYYLGAMHRGGTARVSLRLTPRLPGTRTFQAEVDGNTNSSNGSVAVQEVHLHRTITGHLGPAPHYAIRAKAAIPAAQRLGHEVHMVLVIYNTGSSILHLWMALDGALPGASQSWNYPNNLSWAINWITVNGQPYLPGTDDTDYNNGFVDLGPLGARKDMHATLELLPKQRGRQQLKVTLYPNAIDDHHVLRDFQLDASISR
jgi:hypothetical protein